MLNVKIDEMAALDLLMGRVRVWTDDPKTLDLFQKMYESYIDGGCFDGCEFDPMVIVDNDWVNYCRVVEQDAKDPEWKQLLKIYQKQGFGDCSCECDFASYIESADDDECPRAFLIRM